MGQPRILLADDHRLFLEGLRGLLETDFEIVGMVTDGRELVSKARELKPDIIVSDISMPHLNGIEAMRQLKRNDPSIKIVLLTMHNDVSYASRGFEAGASGYLLKQAAANELVTAIREVLKGRTYVTPMVAGDLIRSYREDSDIRPDDIAYKLTPRQREVLQLLAEGMSAKEVAATLDISTRTVEFHKYRMMEALNLKTSAELVQYAIKHGIISL
jgi:DNA-binding NarL/FixJ family response regulator